MTRLRFGSGVLVGLILACGLMLTLRSLRAEDEKGAKLPAAEVEAAFDILRRAIGERARRDGTLADPVSAPDATDAVSRLELSTSFSDQQLEALLKETRKDVGIREAGLLQYRDDASEVVIIRNLKESGIQFRYYGRIKGKWSVESMNKWNEEKRLTKAYLDVDRDPTLEMDVVVAGGLTLDSIRESLSLFDYSVTAFRDHLKQNNEAK